MVSGWMANGMFLGILSELKAEEIPRALEFQELRGVTFLADMEVSITPIKLCGRPILCGASSRREANSGADGMRSRGRAAIVEDEG